MNVSLNPYFDDFINEKVKSGKYNSASEVIRAALRLLEVQEQEQKAQIEYFKNKIREGIDSGEAVEWDMDSFLRRAESRAELT